MGGSLEEVKVGERERDEKYEVQTATVPCVLVYVQEQKTNNNTINCL